MSHPDPHVIKSTAPHTHTIILLHGRGSSATEFAKELFEARTSKNPSLPAHLPGWKWVFPSSLTHYSTMFEEELSEWFDIRYLTNTTDREELQIGGLRESVAFIRQLIEDEAASVPFANIALGGISQGCATAARVLLEGQHRMGAFVGFCGWMPFPSNIHRFANNAATTTPAFLGHCKNDVVVEFGLGVDLRDRLRGLGMELTWRGYEDGGHWIKEPPKGLTT